MPYFEFIWTDEIIEHLAQHGVSQDDFEYVACNPQSRGFSRASGLPAAWGHTPDGRYLLAVFEEIDDVTLLPTTAYIVLEPR